MLQGESERRVKRGVKKRSLINTMCMDWLMSLGVTSWLLSLTCLIVFYRLLTTDRKPHHLPPTPVVALPFIGHLYLRQSNPRQQFLHYSKTVGPVFKLKIGNWTTVVLNTFDVIKEALVKQGDVFSHRPATEFMLRHFPHMQHGIILSSGPIWKQQRTTSLTILRRFGMGKNILAEKIADEVTIFVKQLTSTKGKPTNLKTITNLSVSNVICSMVFGQRFEFTDSKFSRLIELYDHYMEQGSGVTAIVVMPFLRHIPFDPFGFRSFGSLLIEIRSIIKEFVQNEIDNNNDTNGDNFIAAYIKEMKKAEVLGQQTYLNEDNLIGCIDNLIFAGTETTSTTILWGLLYVLHHPDTHYKIYQEILEQIGTERVPNMLDKPRLKYLNAFIMETQRLASLVPFCIPHVCCQDTVLMGFNIPKDSQVIINLDSVLRDEKIWGDPENFRPERFLDERGNLIKREELIPFSIGRRICLGESLAKMELFLFLSSMFQRFEFLPVDPDHLPTMKEVLGGTASPAPFEIRCVRRI